MSGLFGSSASAARWQAISNNMMAQQAIEANKEAANVQGRYNVTAALMEQLMNNSDQTTPLGNLRYETIGSYEFALPDGSLVSIPKTRAVTELNPQAQQAFNQQQQFDINSNQVALDQLGRVSSKLATPYTIDEASIQAKIDKMINPRLDKREARDTTALASKLANQGIKVGSDAYTDANNDLYQAFADARGEETRQARAAAINENLSERQQPLAELQALLGYGAVQQPSFQALPKTSLQAPDYLGAVSGANANALNTAVAGSNNILKAKQADSAGIMSAIGSAIGLGTSIFK